MYEWTQPVGGMKVQWRRLAVGEEFDILAAHRREEQKHLIAPMLLLRRIVKYGDRDQCSLADLRQWDTFDYECFADEVSLIEAQHRAAIRQKISNREAPALLETLEASAQTLQLALIDIQSSMQQFIENAKAVTSQGGGSPLASPKR